ncbi:DUF4085 family protein [Paenibacillus pinisoli]|uniref:DUF4085 family protein n=1 Tax=Paenibacillus pinisoli TaxID=1276110 RepID=UPI001403753B|nr:DUF4085 family protein [Paenibacillus pinisoli]
MKYFTAEQYRKMQIRGFLVFHESEEDYAADRQWYVENDRDYEAESLAFYSYLEPIITRHMPQELQEAIKRGEGDLKRMGMPSTEFRRKAEAWKQDLEREWEEARDAYWTRYRRVESKLPEERSIIHRLHDARVIAATVSEDEKSIELLLDCSGSMLGHAHLFLRFEGVTHYEALSPLPGNHWLYEELDVSGGGFELRALLDSGSGLQHMNELVIRASRVTAVSEPAAHESSSDGLD